MALNPLFSLVRLAFLHHPFDDGQVTAWQDSEELILGNTQFAEQLTALGINGDQTTGHIALQDRKWEDLGHFYHGVSPFSVCRSAATMWEQAG